MAHVHAHVTVETPDGTRIPYSGPGETVGAEMTEDELRAAAETAALADAPPGSRVIAATVTTSPEE